MSMKEEYEYCIKKMNDLRWVGDFLGSLKYSNRAYYLAKKMKGEE